MTHARTAFAETNDQEIVDAGDGNAIKYRTYGTYMPITTGASGETNTLADPTSPSQELTLHCVTHGGGDRVVTASTAINQTGNTIMTFGAADDSIVLGSVQKAGTAGAYRWNVKQNDGVALS